MALKVAGYKHFGGRHWDSAGMTNMLAHAGVVSPATKKPLSESMVFGIMGGIGVGYSFCPSIPRHGMGSGISVVGRHRIYVTQGTVQKALFARLGVKAAVKEPSGVKAAFKNLRDGLEAGKSVLVWTTPMKITHRDWPGTCGMYTTVVHGIDEDAGEAYLADLAPSSLTVTLDDLAWARNRVCSLKNRSLTIEPPKKLDSATLKKAVMDGLHECANELVRPKMSTFGLPGLEEWSKMITNDKNAKGWGRVYPKSRLFWALRDVFCSIETAGTGGSLFRPMYAEFLEDAADVTGRKALRDCADRYRALGEEWSALAAAALPDSVKPFKKARQLLMKRSRLYEERGPKAQFEKAGAELIKLEQEINRKFPLDGAERAELLEGLRERIEKLHAREADAAGALTKAVA